MAAVKEIRIEGVSKLLKKLDSIADLQLDLALNKACSLVENEAKVRCPVDTGALRASITHKVRNNVGEVGTNMHYAPYVEFGTGIYAANGDGRQEPWVYKSTDGTFYRTEGQDPQPFLEPALTNNEDSILLLLKQEIERLVRQIAKL